VSESYLVWLWSIWYAMMNYWCLWLWYVDLLNDSIEIDCIVWIAGIWGRWSCWIMDLIGATYYNLKLLLTIAYSRSTNWSNETDPDCSKNLNLWLMISDTTLSLTMAVLSVGFYEPISVGHRDVKMSFDPWANPAHHRFEPDWVEKNSFFFKSGLNSTRLT